LSLTLALCVVEFAIPVSGAKVLPQAYSVEKQERNYRFKTVEEKNEEL